MDSMFLGALERLCQEQDPAKRAEQLSKLLDIANSADGLRLQAMLACQEGEREDMRELKKRFQDEIIKKLFPMAYLKGFDGKGENVKVVLRATDWINSDATFSLDATTPCKPTTVTLVGGRAVAPEATGEVAKQQASTTATTAVVIPEESAQALQTCSYTLQGAPLTASIRGLALNGTIFGDISLAPVATTDGSLRALPTSMSLKIKSGNKVVNLDLDKGCAFNALTADAAGNGEIRVGLQITSNSDDLAGNIHVGDKVLLAVPVTVQPSWGSVTLRFSPSTPGSDYTPVAARTLLLTDGTHQHQTSAPLTGEPCEDVDGNGVPDGVDRYRKSIERRRDNNDICATP